MAKGYWIYEEGFVPEHRRECFWLAKGDDKCYAGPWYTKETADWHLAYWEKHYPIENNERSRH